MSRPSCHPNGPNTRLSSTVPLPSSLSFESRSVVCKHSFFYIGTCTLRYANPFFSLVQLSDYLIVSASRSYPLASCWEHGSPWHRARAQPRPHCTEHL